MPMLTGNLLSNGLKNDGTVNSYLGHKKEAGNKSFNLLLQYSVDNKCVLLLRGEGEQKRKTMLTLPSPLVVFSLQVVRFQVENSREAGFRCFVQQ